MEYIKLKEASKLIGKSERTIRNRVAKLARKDKERYIKRGDKNALLISKEWLLKDQQGVGEAVSIIEILHEQLRAKDQQIESLQERLKESNINMNRLQERIPLLSMPDQKEKKESWLSNLFSKKVL
jgi:hypothetical protein